MVQRQGVSQCCSDSGSVAHKVRMRGSSTSVAAQPAVLGKRCHKCATQPGEARGCVTHNHKLTRCCYELTGASTSALGQAQCKSWTLLGRTRPQSQWGSSLVVLLV